MELFFLFVLGLAIGSFLNVLIDRLPRNKSIVGRSRCDFCKKQLTAKDLIPVFSYLTLKGKCRYCRRKLSLQYPLIELLTGFIFVFSWLYLPVTDTILKIVYLGLISTLIVVFLADWKYHIIPDLIQVTLLIFCIVILYLQPASQPVFWLDHLRSGVIVMLPILLIYLVTKGKGMGFADVKLAFIIGFFLQLTAGLYAIYFAFVSGAIYGIFLIILKKKKMKDSIAFGPFLALGFVLMIFFGPSIISFFAKFYF